MGAARGGRPDTAGRGTAGFPSERVPRSCMHAVLFVCLATAADPTAALSRVGDDATLAVALDRSAGLAERLLTALPDAGRASPHARVRALRDDCRRDAQRLRGAGQNCVFEATVLLTYADLCQLTAGQFGAEQVKFRPTRNVKPGELKIADGAGNGGGAAPGKAKVSFAETLF